MTKTTVAGQAAQFYREGYNLPARIFGKPRAKDVRSDGYLKRAIVYSRDKEADFALDGRLSARLLRPIT